MEEAPTLTPSHPHTLTPSHPRMKQIREDASSPPSGATPWLQAISVICHHHHFSSPPLFSLLPSHTWRDAMAASRLAAHRRLGRLAQPEPPHLVEALEDERGLDVAARDVGSHPLIVRRVARLGAHEGVGGSVKRCKTAVGGGARDLLILYALRCSAGGTSSRAICGCVAARVRAKRVGGRGGCTHCSCN
eukprot:55613-Chlamydomonas_euryale.AAC.1